MKDIETTKYKSRQQKKWKGYNSLGCEDRLRKLDIPSLRCRGDTIEVFKILHSIYDKLITTEFLTFMKGSITRGHCFKLHKQQSRLDVCKEVQFSDENSKPVGFITGWCRVTVSFEAKLDIVHRHLLTAEIPPKSFGLVYSSIKNPVSALTKRTAVTQG